jgi:hypothetical protein
MPYFNNDKINLLYIHIPKSGGTSIENYFCEKYNLSLDITSWLTLEYIYNNHSLQHTTYQEIINDPNYFKLNINDLKIMTCVRNPYKKFISALFYNKFVSYHNLNDISSLEKDIINIIEKLKEKNTIYDNHFLPQYKFLIIDENDEKINNNIIILQNENLKNDMEKYGFMNFEKYLNKNDMIKNDDEYYLYINENILNIINTYYEKDFEFFNYKKLTYLELLNIQINISRKSICKLYGQLESKNNEINDIQHKMTIQNDIQKNLQKNLQQQQMVNSTINKICGKKSMFSNLKSKK